MNKPAENVRRLNPPHSVKMRVRSGIKAGPQVVNTPDPT
jgi:hypothetical protein